MIKDDKKYWLNEHGRRYWSSKADPFLTATRAYHWIDRIIFIDESEGDREYVGETTFTEFGKKIKYWIPTTKEQYEELLEKHRNE